MADTPNRLTRTDDRYSHDAFYKVKAKYLAHWLADHNPHHPKVYLWGGGRVSRRRSDYLVAHGIEVVQYIDVKPKANALFYENIPAADEAFIVSYVANRGVRDQIRNFLLGKRYQEGLNFIMAS